MMTLDGFSTANPVRALATNTCCFAGRITPLAGRRGLPGLDQVFRPSCWIHQISGTDRVDRNSLVRDYWDPVFEEEIRREG